MPPRFSYWTILAGGLPTAFRAVDRDELLPTFHRLREKHSDAVLKWFARGRLWESPEEARAELERKRQSTSGWHRDRSAGTSSTRAPRRDGVSGGPGPERRDRGWRPGGEHRDPRQKFADAKKARNAAQRKQRFERKHGGPARPHDGPPHAKPFEARRAPMPAPHQRDRFEGGYRGERGVGGKAGGAHADRPRPFNKDRHRDGPKAGGAHADRPRPFNKDRHRDGAKAGGAHADRPRPFNKDRHRDGAKAGGAHADRPRPFSKDRHRDGAKAGGAHADRPRPFNKDRPRDNAKAGGRRALDRPTFNRNQEAPERAAPPRDTNQGGGPSDKPAAAGARPGSRHDERKRRVPRS